MNYFDPQKIQSYCKQHGLVDPYPDEDGQWWAHPFTTEAEAVKILTIEIVTPPTVTGKWVKGTDIETEAARVAVALLEEAALRQASKSSPKPRISSSNPD